MGWFFLMMGIPPLFLLGWVLSRWLSMETKFEPPVWKSGAALIAFLLSGCSVALWEVCLSWGIFKGGYPNYDPILLWFIRWGFLAAVSGLLLGLIGKGKLRWPSVLAGFYTLFLWFIAGVLQ